MSFYSRKIPYYKSLRLIDTDGDGIKDTITYKPFGDYYYVQFGMEQTIKNIGHYNVGVNDDFEVIDSSYIWDESNNGNNNNNPNEPPPLTNITGGTLGTGLQQEPTAFCSDPEASNYNPSLIGNSNFEACSDNSCCNYAVIGDYSSGTNDGSTENLECLPMYSDWGPWNNNLLLNDTNQIYNTKDDCTLTFRLINTSYDIADSFFNLKKGGWYGASIKIEVDNGLGFETITPGNPLLLNIESNDITYNIVSETFTLGEKVKLWATNDGSAVFKSYFSTKPFRDLTIKTSANSTVRVTYYNGPLSSSPYNNTRLQLIKGTETVPTPFNPISKEPESTWGWEQYSLSAPTLNTFLSTPNTRLSEGESFHFIGQDGGVTVQNTIDYINLMNTYWGYYLNGYGTNTNNNVPWGVSNIDIEAGDFYINPSIEVLYDFGNNTSNNILQYASSPFNNSTNPIANPFEELVTFNFICDSTNNYVSYFDKNGDGFIEYDINYPAIDPTNPGSVDTGLFSKTRYDSPYVYLKPGTFDGSTDSLDNQLTTNIATQATMPTGQISSAGWVKYGYIGASSQSSYVFKNVSPTCQLGGCDNIININPSLTDQSNSNIFLPQSDYSTTSNMSECANIYDVTGSSGVTIGHLWNYGSTDAKGGCCAKRYDSSLVMDENGPWLASKCSKCHSQMTTRSAQPIFNNDTKIQMQTTDSDVYYGPFYDPTNPTYNGYGLAFSKANKFCRDVKNKNGVNVIYNPLGTAEEKLFIGGILHGEATQVTPTTDINDNYGVTQATSGFEVVGYQVQGVELAGCSSLTKLPLKCTIVTNDPNCPNGTTCVKCLYCFKCSLKQKTPGIFTGNNGNGSTGPNNGVEEIG